MGAGVDAAAGLAPVVVFAGVAVFAGVVAGLAGDAAAFGAGLPAGACAALATGPEVPKARHVTSATAAWLRERLMSLNLHGVRRWQADHAGTGICTAHAGRPARQTTLTRSDESHELP
jgi:hypothetical protein